MRGIDNIINLFTMEQESNFGMQIILTKEFKAIVEATIEKAVGEGLPAVLLPGTNGMRLVRVDSPEAKDVLPEDVVVREGRNGIEFLVVNH